MRTTLDQMYFNSVQLALLNEEIVHKILKVYIVSIAKTHIHHTMGMKRF